MHFIGRRDKKTKTVSDGSKETIHPQMFVPLCDRFLIDLETSVQINLRSWLGCHGCPSHITADFARNDTALGEPQNQGHGSHQK
jgi:hypothetical protein